MKVAAVMFSILILSIALLAAATCCHDNNIMRENNDSMRQALAEMQHQQAAQAAEIRQIKTDTEMALRVVITGEYMEAE